ncbi:MAG: polymer-forming cytoskeletal protein, partial [Haliea sp.]|uniref:polymer-forming cytoskeletal protein n=1 Tax=Haliea sp. TaxID=1932666 RepID=UPI0032ECC71F
GPQGRFQATGSVRLDGARIDAGVNLSGALLQVDGQPALSARSATVGGNVDLLPGEGYRCEVHGEVALVAAQITGDLNCGSARLVNPGGRTLHCEDLVVESVFLTRDLPDLPFESHGRINFLTAVIGGGLFVTNARLSPGPDYSGLLGRGGMVALNAQQIRISNSLVLFNVGAPEADGVFRQDEITPIEGWFLLAGAQMNALIDSVDTGWPAPGYIDLDGTSYQRIRHLDQGELVSKRVAWLRRQFCAGRPEATSYRPQPYEQLTRVLRNSGLSREADAIAVEKIRMRLAARVDRPWLRLFPQLLMLVSHHGYSTSRAVLSFLLFVLFGAAMYTGAVAAFDQAFFPFEQAPEPTTYVLPFGLGTKAVPLGCPGLDTLHYALDFALPVIHLGQDDFCRFVPDGPARWLWLTLHSLFGLFGAALSAVVVLTLTGLLRRD